MYIDGDHPSWFPSCFGACGWGEWGKARRSSKMSTSKISKDNNAGRVYDISISIYLNTHTHTHTHTHGTVQYKYLSILVYIYLNAGESMT